MHHNSLFHQCQLLQEEYFTVPEVTYESHMKFILIYMRKKGMLCAILNATVLILRIIFRLVAMNHDKVVKRHFSDGEVKSFKFKARKSRGISVTLGLDFYEAITMCTPIMSAGTEFDCSA